jgi:hypothetical protein
MEAYSRSIWECLRPAVGWQWTFAPTSLFRLSGVMSQYSDFIFEAGIVTVTGNRSEISLHLFDFV